MVQGTTSSAGKSMLVTALCRIFKQRGLHVAPFKSQNMALNSYVTADGGEIGRAQAVQAEAAGVPCTVDMNPVLLKPEGNSRSQVVVMGKAMGSMSAREYHEYKPELREVIAASLRRLRLAYDLIVIEGAGSPAEINLKENEIVNMFVARLADAPVLLVGDIDRGGVFAAFVGTLELLEAHERARVAGFIVNKFRGDRSLLQPGLDFLTARTGIPVLGVVPYIQRLRVADEDSVSLDDRREQVQMAQGNAALKITVVRLPRISNHDDFMPLEHEPGVRLLFAEQPEQLADADLLILPGSKSTVEDLEWLHAQGFARAIHARALLGKPILGICGGCQMLGEWIEDPYAVESSQSHVDGLGLLPLKTRFERQKLTARVSARAADACFLTGSAMQCELSGYEIHMGAVETTKPAAIPFTISERNGAQGSWRDGAISADGAVAGTMLHGIFENESIRESLLSRLRELKGCAAAGHSPIFSKEAEYERLAAAVRESVDMDAICRTIKIQSGQV